MGTRSIHTRTAFLRAWSRDQRLQFPSPSLSTSRHVCFTAHKPFFASRRPTVLSSINTERRLHRARRGLQRSDRLHRGPPKKAKHIDVRPRLSLASSGSECNNIPGSARHGRTRKESDRTPGSSTLDVYKLKQGSHIAGCHVLGTPTLVATPTGKFIDGPPLPGIALTPAATQTPAHLKAGIQRHADFALTAASVPFATKLGEQLPLPPAAAQAIARTQEDRITTSCLADENEAKLGLLLQEKHWVVTQQHRVQVQQLAHELERKQRELEQQARRARELESHNNALRRSVHTLQQQLRDARDASEEANRLAAVLENELREEKEKETEERERSEHKAFHTQRRLADSEKREQEKQCFIVELCEHNQTLCEQLALSDGFRYAAVQYLPTHIVRQVEEIAANNATSQQGASAAVGAAGSDADTGAAGSDADTTPAIAEESESKREPLAGAGAAGAPATDASPKAEPVEPVPDKGAEEAADRTVSLESLNLQPSPSQGSPKSPAYSACTTPSASGRSTPITPHVDPQENAIDSPQRLEAFREAFADRGGLAALFASDEELFSCSSSEEDPEIKVQPKPLLSQ